MGEELLRSSILGPCYELLDFVLGEPGIVWVLGMVAVIDNFTYCICLCAGCVNKDCKSVRYSFSSPGAHTYNKVQSVMGNLHIYVTLSHLRSKEFKRIHLPCIPQHRETSKCKLVYIEMYPRKVVVFPKKQATFIKARVALMWMRHLSYFYTSSDKTRLRE